jgi:hypothetical protein
MTARDDVERVLYDHLDRVPFGLVDDLVALIDVDIDTSSIDKRRIGRFQAGAQTTARNAAISAYPRSGTQRRRVFDAIAQAWRDDRIGLTDDEIGRVPGISDTAHRTRRNELVDGGWVRATEATRPSTTGEPSIVWALTERGRIAAAI